MNSNRTTIIFSIMVIILASGFYYYLFEQTQTYRTLEENKNWVHDADTNRN